MGDAPSGSMSFDLPTGWVDAKGELQTRVETREMTGYEEDLIGDDRLPYGVRMNRILAGCTEKLGGVTDKKHLEAIMDQLTSVDRMKMLIMIRVASLGSSLEFEASCPHCQNKAKHMVDLLTLQFEGLKDPKLREYELALPSGKKAKCRVLTGADETKITELQLPEILSGAIMLRLVDLDGGKPSIDSVKKLGLRDRTFLRKSFDSVEGGFERNIQVECSKCRREFETRIDLGMMEMFYKDLRK